MTSALLLGAALYGCGSSADVSRTPVTSVDSPVVSEVGTSGANAVWWLLSTGIRVAGGSTAPDLVPLPRGLVPDGADVTSVDPQHFWIATDRRTGAAAARFEIFRTADSGSTWQSVTLAAPDQAYGRPRLAFDNPSRGWLLLNVRGSSNSSAGYVFTTQDGGVTWTGVGSAPGGVISSTGGALVVSSTKHPLEIHTSPDGGRTWTPPVPFTSGIGSGMVSYPIEVGHDLVVAGTFVAGQDPRIELWRSGDKGVTWVRDAAQRLGSPGTAVAVLDAGTWIVGDASGLRRSTDGGATWAAASGTAPRGGPTALRFSNRNLGVAWFVESTCAAQKSACTTTSSAAITHDGGRTWAAAN